MFTSIYISIASIVTFVWIITKVLTVSKTLSLCFLLLAEHFYVIVHEHLRFSRFETAVPFFGRPLSFPPPPSWIYFFYYWYPISQTYQLWVSFHSSLSTEPFHLIGNLSTIGNSTTVCIICSCLPVLEDPFLNCPLLPLGLLIFIFHHLLYYSDSPPTTKAKVSLPD